MRLTLTFLFISPLPTEKTNKASFLDSPESSNQSLYEFSQPSSLILAVISDILSVGQKALILHNFLKSFTA